MVEFLCLLIVSQLPVYVDNSLRKRLSVFLSVNIPLATVLVIQSRLASLQTTLKRFFFRVCTVLYAVPRFPAVNSTWIIFQHEQQGCHALQTSISLQHSRSGWWCPATYWSLGTLKSSSCMAETPILYSERHQCLLTPMVFLVLSRRITNL